MAVDLTLKGVEITNREASPRVLNNPGLGEGGPRYCAYGYIASVTNALSITSRIRLLSVPSNAIVSSLTIQSAAQGAGSFDVGLYRTNGDGGAVVDQDFFAAAVDCTGAVAETDILNQSTTNTIAKQAQPIWQAAGMAADPKAMLDVVATVASVDVTTGGAALSLRARYVTS